jgi:Neocarzinostatin family
MRAARRWMGVVASLATVVPMVGATAAGGVEPQADLVVEPADGLVDGQGVWMVGRGFDPGEELVVIQCTGEPSHSTCDFSYVGFFAANGLGRFRLPVEARRVIRTRSTDRIDCADRATPCSFVVLDGEGGPRAEAAVSFDPDAPLPDLPRVEPAVRHDVRLGSSGQLVVEGTVTCSEGAAAWIVVEVQQGDELVSDAFGFTRRQCGRRVPWTVRAEPVAGPAFEAGEALVSVVAFAETADWLFAADRTVATVTVR